MSYYLDLFSPETYEAFLRSPRDVSGFRERQYIQATKIKPGDKLICYLTKLSRWIGALEVIEGGSTFGVHKAAAQADEVSTGEKEATV